MRIEDSLGSNEIETPRLKRPCPKCIFYNEESCSAPRIRFEACRACYRIDPKAALRSLLEKIKNLAAGLLTPPAQ